MGVGGLLNVLFELVNDGGWGGNFEFCKVLFDESGMMFFEFWCNEL